MALKSLSDKTRWYFEKALDRMRDEGYSCWGFIFADTGAEAAAQGKRTAADVANQVVLNTFNNHPDPLPLFIMKCENALVVMRNNPPEGFDLEAAEQVVAEAVSGHAVSLPEPESDPTKMQ